MVVDPFDTLGVLQRANESYLEQKHDNKLWNYRESSMSVDSQGETLYSKVQQHYGSQVGSKKLLANVLTQIKDYCQTSFQEEFPDVPFDIPKDLLTHAHSLPGGAPHIGCHDCQRLKVYLENPAHTAFRMLSNPNPLINRFSTYAAPLGLYGRKTHIDLSEQQLKKLALFWLAASDKRAECIEGYTPKSLKELYLKALALIGRAHNWDKTRRVHKKYKDMSATMTMKMVEEEYDDGHLDNPSCGSGIHRRLNQSLIGHKWFQQQRLLVGKYIILEVTGLIHQTMFTYLSQWPYDFRLLEALIKAYVVEIFPRGSTYHQFVDQFVEECIEDGIQIGDELSLTPIDKEVAVAFGQALKSSHQEICKGFVELDKELSLRAARDYKSEPISIHGNKKFKNFHEFFSMHFLGMQPNHLHIQMAKKLDEMSKNQKSTLLAQLKKYQARVKTFEMIAEKLIHHVKSDQPFWVDEKALSDFIALESELDDSDRESIIQLAQSRISQAVPEFSIIPRGHLLGKQQLKIPGDGNCLFTSIFMACLDNQVDLARFFIEDPTQLRVRLSAFMETKYMGSIRIITDVINAFRLYCPHRDYSIIDLSQDYEPTTSAGRTALSALTTGEMPGQMRGFLRDFASHVYLAEDVPKIVAEFCAAIEYVNRLDAARAQYNVDFGANLQTARAYIRNMEKDGVWGGEFEVFNACQLFNIGATIVHQGQSFYAMAMGDETDSKEIELLHCQGNHYNALVSDEKPDMQLVHALANKDISRLIHWDHKANPLTKKFVKQHLGLTKEFLSTDGLEQNLEKQFQLWLTDFKLNFDALEKELKTFDLLQENKTHMQDGLSIDLVADDALTLAMKNTNPHPKHNGIQIKPCAAVTTIEGMSAHQVLAFMDERERKILLTAEKLDLLELSAEVEFAFSAYAGGRNTWQSYVIESANIHLYAKTPGVSGGEKQCVATLPLSYHRPASMTYNMTMTPSTGMGGYHIKLNFWNKCPLKTHAPLGTHVEALLREVDEYIKRLRTNKLTEALENSSTLFELQKLEEKIQAYQQKGWLPREAKELLEHLPKSEAFARAIRPFVDGDENPIPWPEKEFALLKSIDIKRALQSNTSWVQNRRKADEYVIPCETKKKLSFSTMKDKANLAFSTSSDASTSMTHPEQSSAKQASTQARRVYML